MSDMSNPFECVRQLLYQREHDYNWEWDADTWDEDDMDHAASMIGDFIATVDEAERRFQPEGADR